jgi:hypothetical protein
MAIYSNSLHYQRAKFGSGLSNTGGSNPYFNLHSKYIQVHFNNQVHVTTSWATGYRAGTAVLIPLIDGGVSGRVLSQSTTNSNILGDGYMNATLTITVTTSASGNLLANINGTATITISTSGTITGRGFIGGTTNIGAQPSADDIAQAVWMSVAASLNVAGTMGAKLNGAASAGDPWSTTLPGSYTTGEAGKILSDMETLIKQIKALTTAQL